MRATIMHGAGDVRIEKVPDPTIIEPTNALLRVTHACICGSDESSIVSWTSTESPAAIGT